MDTVYLLSASLLSLVVALVCCAVVLTHAFRQSVGTGFMALCIPLFVFYYAFTQFEHRRKGWVLAGLLGGWGLSIMLRAGVTVV